MVSVGRAIVKLSFRCNQATKRNVKSSITVKVSCMCKENLNNIKLTKLRIDMNCTADSLCRSFRRKNVDSGACPCGWEKQSVEDVLFGRVNINLTKARRKSEEGYCIYANTYMYKPLPAKN